MQFALNFPPLLRLPFDKLRPRASRGALVEGRIFSRGIVLSYRTTTGPASVFQFLRTAASCGVAARRAKPQAWWAKIDPPTSIFYPLPLF